MDLNGECPKAMLRCIKASKYKEKPNMKNLMIAVATAVVAGVCAADIMSSNVVG